MTAQWEAIRPTDVADLLDGFPGPWWIAGGWALDLFVGRQTRDHDDIDVAILRRDQLRLHDHLRDWDLRFATPGHVLEPWDGRPLAASVHVLWARRSHAVTAPWTCEFVLNEERDGCWAFRRNLAVKRALEGICLHAGTLPYLRPEIVLLYKAKEPTEKDELDFATVEPRLSPSERRWLHVALESTHPGHRWLERLRT